MARMPTDEQIAVAAEWLSMNEGEEGEAEACKAVVEWIEHLQSERSLRTVARKAGVPVSKARRFLAEKQL